MYVQDYSQPFCVLLQYVCLPAAVARQGGEAEWTKVKGEDLWDYVHILPENTRENPYKIWVTSPIPETDVVYVSHYYFSHDCSYPDWSRYFEVYYSNPDISCCGIYTLTKVIIADSVTSIGEGAFVGCTSLTSVTFNDDNNKWEIVDSSGTSTPVTGGTLVQALKDGESLTKKTN